MFIYLFNKIASIIKNRPKYISFKDFMNLKNSKIDQAKIMLEAGMPQDTVAVFCNLTLKEVEELMENTHNK
jgi:hypothetical protein